MAINQLITAILYLYKYFLFKTCTYKWFKPIKKIIIL